MLKACITCGEPSRQPYCGEHLKTSPRYLRQQERRAEVGYSSRRTGHYDNAWSQLSRKARAQQPWCNRCGAVDDLTADHLRWPARSLADVQVLCRSCNARKGAVVRPQGGQGSLGGSRSRRGSCQDGYSPLEYSA